MRSHHEGHSAAKPQPKSANSFHHEGTKNTKLRNLEISFSETFVSFVSFVVNKDIRVMSEYSQRSLKNLLL